MDLHLRARRFRLPLISTFVSGKWYRPLQKPSSAKDAVCVWAGSEVLCPWMVDNSACTRKAGALSPRLWFLTTNQRRRVGLKVHLAPNRTNRAQKTGAKQKKRARLRSRRSNTRTQLSDCEIATREIGDHNFGELSIRLRSK